MMNSPEYHRCMSEAYFTRATVWFLFAMVVYELVENPFNIILAITNGMLAAIFLLRSHSESREAR